MVASDTSQESSGNDLPHFTPHPAPVPPSSSPPAQIIIQSQLPHTINDQAIYEPSAGTTLSAESIIDPPIPEYSPTWNNDNDVANTLNILPPAVLAPQSVDEDVVRYNLAHGHGDTAAVRRLPEIYPGYTHSLRSSLGPPESLPPYGANDPPRYTRFAPRTAQQEEPQTMARLFFKFGFVFPAFWVFGALMLITPLRSPNPQQSHSVWPPNTQFTAWCNENLETEEEKAEYMLKFQAAEMKWAKRCLLACFFIVCFSIAIGATVFGVIKATTKTTN